MAVARPKPPLLHGDEGQKPESPHPGQGSDENSQEQKEEFFGGVAQIHEKWSVARIMPLESRV